MQSPIAAETVGITTDPGADKKSVITTDITEAVIVIPIRPDMHRTTRYKKERQLTTAGIFPFTERSRQKKKKNLYKLFGGCTMQPPKK